MTEFLPLTKMKKTRWLSSFDSLFNMSKEDMSTLTHSFFLNDPHMQMSYIWARMMLKRGPGPIKL